MVLGSLWFISDNGYMFVYKGIYECGFVDVGLADNIYEFGLMYEVVLIIVFLVNIVEVYCVLVYL